LGYAVARFQWRNRGALFVWFAILVCAQAWWIPQLVTTFALRTKEYHHALQFTDWFVTGFSIVFFWMVFGNLPSACFDQARLDGLNGFRIWLHIVLPKIAIPLVFVAIFTALATWDLTMGSFVGPLGPSTAKLFRTKDATAGLLGFFAILSMIATIPLLGIFFLAKKLLPPTASSHAALSASWHGDTAP
jgi:ABC-type glycerol-3-phosphate transport system permease component